MRLINGAACGNMHHAPVTADHGAVRAGYEPLAPRQTTQEGRNLGLIMTNRPAVALPSYAAGRTRSSRVFQSVPIAGLITASVHKITTDKITTDRCAKLQQTSALETSALAALRLAVGTLDPAADDLSTPREPAAATYYFVLCAQK